MSQIGYMIMAVSSGAYVAGLFHLMTHAFFKALLFMAAGSVISRDGGRRRTSTGWAASARRCRSRSGASSSAASRSPACRRSPASSPRTRSSPPSAREGGWHIILAVLGYIVAFMTAVYTFRMIFRAFLGEAVPEARELEEGHLHHADVHTNPRVRRGRGHRRRLPGPRPPHRRARALDEGRHDRPRDPHDHRRLHPDPVGRPTSSRRSSSRRSRARSLRVGAPVQRADRLRPDHRHDHRPHGHRRSPTSSGSAPGHARSASACG